MSINNQLARLMMSSPRESCTAQSIVLLLHVNDMLASSKCLLVQYADNTTALAPVTLPFSVSGVQNFLDQIGCWARTNNLAISQHKSTSTAMHLTKSFYFPFSLHPVRHSNWRHSVDSYLRSYLLYTSLGKSPTLPQRHAKLLALLPVFQKPGGLKYFVHYILPWSCLGFSTVAVWHPFQAHLVDRLKGVQCRATRALYFRMLGQHAPAPPYEAQGRQHRQTVAWVGLLCRLLDSSMEGTPLGSYMRIGKRSGQQDPELARTVRHTNSVLPAALRDFLAAPCLFVHPLLTRQNQPPFAAHSRNPFSRVYMLFL